MKKGFTFALILFLFSCSDIPFDKRKWNEKEDILYKYRKNMVSDLVKNYLHSKMSKEEIINLLDDSNERHLEEGITQLRYEVYVDFGWDIDPVEHHYLVMDLDEGLLSDVYLEIWTRGDGTKIQGLQLK